MFRAADELANFRVANRSPGIARIHFNGAPQGPVGYGLEYGATSRE